MFTRISHDPAVMGGRACIRGMRLTVAQVMRLLASGMTHAEIIKAYPDLEAADLTEAMRYSAALASEELHPFEPLAA